MDREHGTICRIEVNPKDELETGSAKFYFAATQGLIATTAEVKYVDNYLLICGIGLDGRCAFCRHFRRSLKLRCIDFQVKCPIEIVPLEAGSVFDLDTGFGSKAHLVKIGGYYYEQTCLEDETNLHRYQAISKEAPDNQAAHVTLGLMYEYRGRFAEAASAYWCAYELDAGNKFVRARLLENLELLIKSCPGAE